MVLGAHQNRKKKGISLMRLLQKSGITKPIFSFTLLDSPDINAFALPGGLIYVNRGLLAYLDTEAELAGVLAHEIGHITERHHSR